MPFYEYQAKDKKKSCKYCKNSFEHMQKISDSALTRCPKCKNKIIRLISLPHGVIIKGRAANQYNDIKQAKYWKDQYGVKHRVTAADGSTKSPTVSKNSNTKPKKKKR